MSTYDELRQIALQNNIPVEYEQKKIREGWMGKPKGIIQILFERGFINATNMTGRQCFSCYSMNGKIDENGNIVAGTSLRSMISNLPDFKEELTLLQFRALQMGVRIECSPKFHPEIAGEGIEYSWGLAKNTYRSFPLKQKKTKEGFRKLVQCSLNPEVVMTKSAVRKFARRQRRYILAYLGLENAKEANSNATEGGDGGNGGDGNDRLQVHIPEMSCCLVERLVKVFKEPQKCHRNIKDQDATFLKSIAEWMRQVNNRVGEEEERM